MKKLSSLLRASALCAALLLSQNSFAQNFLTDVVSGAVDGAMNSIKRASNTGFTVGINLNGASQDAGGAFKQFQVGTVTRIELPAGFALQPGIFYNVKGQSLSLKDIVSTSRFYTSVGYIEVPVQIQWGMEVYRNIKPFAFVEPFIGYGINTKSLFGNNRLEDLLSGNISEDDLENLDPDDFTLEDLGFGNFDPVKMKNDFVNRLEYGVGGGIGVEFFNIIQISMKYYSNIGKLYNKELEIPEDMKEQRAAHGFTFSLGFLF